MNKLLIYVVNQPMVYDLISRWDHVQRAPTNTPYKGTNQSRAMEL